MDKLNIQKVEVIRTYKKKLIVSYVGKEYNVDAYPIQLEIVPKVIVVRVNHDKLGYPVLEQVKSSNLRTYYKEGYSYKFKVVGKQGNPSALVLIDGFNAKHKLFKPNLQGLQCIGKIIDCRVDKVCDGSLILSCPKYQIEESDDVIETADPISQEELRLFEILHKKRAQQFASMNDHSMRGVWSSVVDKYPDSAHFIYELLQNADDAEATEVEIYLDKDVVFFKHNGKIQFSVTDDYDERIVPGHINAITAIGDSTKGKDGKQKIGKFGVGFKAVFDYTDTPIIFTDTFKFKIEHYIVPELISYDSELRKKGETLFEIPFKRPDKGYSEIYDKLRNLQNPILFLSNLKKITWFDLTEFEHMKTYSKQVVFQRKKGNVLCEKIMEKSPNGTKTLWLFSRTITLGGKGKWPISVGYFLKDVDGKEVIDTEEKQQIYCFFPTSESFGTCFISHAPFLLVDNRQQIKRNEDVNKVMQNELSKLACDSLGLLRDIGLEFDNYLLNENLLDIVPIEKEYYYGEKDIFSAEQLAEPFLETLKQEALFLSRNNKYLKASEIRLAQPVSLVDLLSAEQLKLLNGNGSDSVDFMKEAPTTKDHATRYYLTEEVGIEVFSSSNLAESLTSEFMQEQSMDWVLKLYSFLNQDARDLCFPRYEGYPIEKLLFRYAPIVKTESGDWLKPYNGNVVNVFFGGDSSVGYNIVANEYFQNERAKKFLVDLGIKEPDMLDYIKTQVLPKYKNSETLSVTDIINDFDFIYQHSIKIPAGEFEDYISIIRNDFRFLFVNGEGKECFGKSELLYYPTKELKAYFKGFNELKFEAQFIQAKYDFSHISFLDEKAYEPVFRKHGKDKICRFIEKIGVSFSPKIIQKKIDRDFLWHLSESQKKSLELYSFSYNKKEGGSDYYMEGLSYALKHNLTRELSSQIWKWLEFCVEDTELLTYKFHHYSYFYKSCDSSYVYLLKTTPWIYINQRTTMAPCDLSIEDMSSLMVYYPAIQRVYSLLDIKKRTKSIDDIDGLDEEMRNIYNKGKQVDLMCKKHGLSMEELEEMACQKDAEKKEKERREKERAKASAEQQANRKAMPEVSSKETFEDVTPYEKAETIKQGKGGLENNKPELTTNAEENLSAKTAEKVQEIEKRYQEERDNAVERETKRGEIASIEEVGGKYSIEWFEKLLELEAKNEGDNVETFGRKSVTLSFSKVEKEVGSDRIYVLKNPSSIIPLEVEQIGGLIVEFSFFHDLDNVKFGFEVASVKDFTLRLKAKMVDAEHLQKIDWNICSKATIQINNSVALIEKLSDAYKELEIEPGTNLKDNLGDNISFVFGPPGTGKTTHLAKKIISLINENDSCRILVLTPTNKACDVIANKIADMEEGNAWLGRFLTTGSERLENEGYVCDINSNLYEQEKCCIVTTTVRLPYDGFGMGYDRVLLKDIEWDYVIIDEASMIPLAQVVYAIYKFPSSQIVIAGDPMQIMPIVREEAWKDENIYTMVKLDQFDNPKTEPRQFEILNLSTQYRAVPAIGRLFSEFSYQGRLSHNRSADSIKPLKIKGFEGMKPVNFITFKVDKYDNICGPKKLASSNVHVYSVLLVTEMCQYFAKQYEKTKKKAVLKIGIICPYAAQAQMIEKLLEQSNERPENVEITVGTIHGFQGDECDIIFAVFNPPKGLKYAPDKVLVNNKNILNVAISRARDYLFIFMPQKDTDGFDRLNGIINIGRIAIEDKDNMTFLNADQVEQIIFKQKGYIESNTFVTSHQMANVYSRPSSKYEVRIDENSVDIQIETE